MNWLEKGWSQIQGLATQPETWMIVMLIIFLIIIFLQGENDREEISAEISFWAQSLRQSMDQQTQMVQSDLARLSQQLTELQESENPADETTLDPYYADEASLELAIAKKREQEYIDKMNEASHQKRINEIKSEQLKVREKEANI